MAFVFGFLPYMKSKLQSKILGNDKEHYYWCSVQKNMLQSKIAIYYFVKTYLFSSS